MFVFNNNVCIYIYIDMYVFIYVASLFLSHSLFLYIYIVYPMLLTLLLLSLYIWIISRLRDDLLIPRKEIFPNIYFPPRGPGPLGKLYVSCW